MLLENAYDDAGRGQWSKALHQVEQEVLQNPDNEQARAFFARCLAYFGRNAEARKQLAKISTLEPADEFLANCLIHPRTRLQPLEPTGTVTHALYDTRALKRADIQVVGEFTDGLLEQCLSFHRREFPHHELTFHELSTKQPGESFEELRDLLDTGQTPEWVKNESVYLVAADSPNRTAFSRGYGSSQVAVIQLMEGDPYQATTIMHELYHTLLDLTHSNGIEGPDDLGSIMGPWGLAAPLLNTYVSNTHRLACTTTSEVQSLIEQGEYQRALELDPNYLGLYQKLSQQRLQKGQLKAAAETLERWFKVDPGPESCSAWQELALLTSISLNPDVTRCRGYGTASNTHIYLAQGCNRAYRFQAALSELKTALDLDPHNLYGQAMLGWAHHCLGNLQIARNAYQTVLAVVPEWNGIKLRLELLESELLSKGYKGQELVSGLTGTDDDECWLVALLGSPKKGLAVLSQTSSQECVHLRGVLNCLLDRTEEARKEFEHSQALNPFSLHGLAGRAWLAHLDRDVRTKDLAKEVLAWWSGEPTCGYLL